MAKQTWYQKQQQKERTMEKEHHHSNAVHAAPPAEKFGAVPVWLKELVSILEAIWGALPASQSEPNHVVTQKLAEFKARLPE